MALSTDDKFNEADRDRIVKELEDILQCDFSKIDNDEMLFSDNAGNRYYVLGGRGNWHGIRKEVIDIYDNSYKETFLIIAKMFKTRIVIFKAPIEPLIEHKDKLSPTDTHYQFNSDIEIKERHLTIRQLPGYCLETFGEFSYPDEIREKAKRAFHVNKDITKYIATLSDEQKLEFLKELIKNEKEL